MKQVTMESVKERIARIENGASATKMTGIGLSLQHEFELACLRELLAVTEQVRQLTEQRDAVVAENVELRGFGDKLNNMHNDLNGEGTGIQGRAEVACQLRESKGEVQS